MARISGVDIPDHKRAEIGLTYIFGIGKSTATYILTKAGIDVNTKIGDLDDEQQKTVRNIISEEFKIEGVLKSEIQLSIKRLMDIGCYRGLRHRKGLPVRGQHTISRTPKKTRRGTKRRGPK